MVSPSTKVNSLTLSSDFAGNSAKHFGGRAIISDGMTQNTIFYLRRESEEILNELSRVLGDGGRGIKWEFQSSKGSSFKVLLAFNLC